MIAEAREIRENQTFRSNALSCAVTSAEPKDQHLKVITLNEYVIKFISNMIICYLREMTSIVVQ